MNRFIEVHARGERRLINLDWVEEIRESEGKVTIYFAFNTPDSMDQDWVVVDETWNAMLEKVVGADNE